MATEPKKIASMSSLWKPFATKIRTLDSNMKAIGHPMKIIETIRTYERQAWLYASGRTRPGKILTQTMHSNHFVGKACDVMPVSGNWNDTEFFKHLKIEAEKLGLNTLDEIGDFGHIEWTEKAEIGKKKANK